MRVTNLAAEVVRLLRQWVGAIRGRLAWPSDEGVVGTAGDEGYPKIPDSKVEEVFRELHNEKRTIRDQETKSATLLLQIIAYTDAANFGLAVTSSDKIPNWFYFFSHIASGILILAVWWTTRNRIVRDHMTYKWLAARIQVIEDYWGASRRGIKDKNSKLGRGSGAKTTQRVLSYASFASIALLFLLFVVRIQMLLMH